MVCSSPAEVELCVSDLAARGGVAIVTASRDAERLEAHEVVLSRNLGQVPGTVLRMNRSSDVVPIEGCSVRVVDADRVAAVRVGMPSDADVTNLADVFGLVADPGRLRLMVALLGGELCVCDLAAAAGLSESATSHALRILRAHRVVSVRRSGRMAYYAVADAHVRMLLDVALAHVEHSEMIHDHPPSGCA